MRRRGWVSREEFLDLLGATNLIPGPNSTELAIHLGRARAGAAGLLVAGSCFILPAAAVTVAIAWAFVRYGSLPQLVGFLHGVKPPGGSSGGERRGRAPRPRAAASSPVAGAAGRGYTT